MEKLPQCIRSTLRSTLDEVDCNKVQKLDYVGHAQKRMVKALRNLQKDKGKPADNKAVGGKPDRLTKTVVQKLQKYSSNSIRNNAKQANFTPGKKKSAIGKMKIDIKAGLHSSCNLPDKERHKYCSATWC